MQNDERRNERNATLYAFKRMENCNGNRTLLEMEQRAQCVGKLAVNYWVMAQQRRLRHRFKMETLTRNWQRLYKAIEKVKPI